MGITVYWKYDNYLSDTENGFTFHFNSNQARLHGETEIGDDLFAVSGVRAESGFEILLLAHLIIKAKTFNPPGYKYGRLKIWADERRSRYLYANEKPLTPLLTQLDSIRHFNDDERHKYSQAFQTIRKLSENDIRLLRAFAETMRIHPKTEYRFPDKEYEESLQQAQLLETIVENEQISADSKKSLIKRVGRNRALVKELNETYTGRCQLCAFDPITYYGSPLCVAHHILYISRGGEDSLDNLLLVCPTCHEAIHKSDAVFDFKDSTFRFDNGRISPLVMNKHLSQSSDV